jgi:hypothetical protein
LIGKSQKPLIGTFAKAHRLNVTKETEDLVILGRRGQIYERNEEESQLAVMFMPPKTAARNPPVGGVRKI